MDFDMDFSSPLYVSFSISSKIGFLPNVPSHILPFRPALKHLKNAIRFLEQKYGEKVEVSRWDGRKLPPTKHDYEVALTNYRPSPLPLDVLLTILSYSLFPTVALLLSKEVARHADRECFYRRVCCNLGYSTVRMDSYKEFFLSCVDIRPVMGKGDRTRRVYMTRGKTLLGTVYVRKDFATAGQLRHLALERGFSIPVPDDPWEVVDLTKVPHLYQVKSS